jgi:hypothetical protein
MFGADGVSRRNFHFGEKVRIRIEMHASRRLETPLINFGVRRGDGVIVCNFNNWFDNFRIDYVEGDCVLEGWLPPMRWIPYHYEIHVLAWERFRGGSQSDLSRLKPLANTTFGEFSIEGPSLTDQEGVFQEPAKRWVLTRGNERFEYEGMNAGTLEEVFSEASRQSEKTSEMYSAMVERG